MAEFDKSRKGFAEHYDATPFKSSIPLSGATSSLFERSFKTCVIRKI